MGARFLRSRSALLAEFREAFVTRGGSRAIGIETKPGVRIPSIAAAIHQQEANATDLPTTKADPASQQGIKSVRPLFAGSLL